VQETPKGNEGVIESYNEARGFGFISSRTPPRIFFHVSSVVGRQKALPGRKSCIRIGNHAEGTASRPCGAYKAERSDTKQTWSVVLGAFFCYFTVSWLPASSGRLTITHSKKRSFAEAFGIMMCQMWAS
jgi:cold shock CspA family protein